MAENNNQIELSSGYSQMYTEGGAEIQQNAIRLADVDRESYGKRIEKIEGVTFSNQNKIRNYSFKKKRKGKSLDDESSSEEDGFDVSDETQRRRQLRRESREACLTNAFVNRPCCMMLLVYGLCWYLAYLSYALDYFKIANSGSRDFLIWDHPIVKNWDMRNLARMWLAE